MYTGPDHDSKICPACGSVLKSHPNSCAICWHGPESGLLIKDSQLGVWVHQHCLDFFGCDNVLQFEQQYYDS